MINQLFNTNPSTEILIKCLNAIGWLDINDSRVFIRTDLDNANIAAKVKLIYPELKDYYIPCKQYKYLRTWTTKSVITIARQLLKTVGWTITGTEKVINNNKNMVYKLAKLNKSKTNIQAVPTIIKTPHPATITNYNCQQQYNNIHTIQQQNKFIVVWN